MKPLLITAVAAMAAVLPLAAQSGAADCCKGRGMQANGAAPVAAKPIVEFKGVIQQVHISRGEGMPYLDVKHGSGTTKVYLGSMRYLIASDFNPKAGQDVTVKGYKLDDSVVAIEAGLPAEKKTLKLRDEKGLPLWRGGPMRSNRPRTAVP